MGEGEADEPPLRDRNYSFAKFHASDRASQKSRDSSPPRTLGSNHVVSDNVTRSRSARLTASPNSNDGTKEQTRVSRNNVPDAKPKALPPPAPPPPHTQDESKESATIGPVEKPGRSNRLKGRLKEFLMHMKNAFFHSWINILLIFVPIGIGLNWLPNHGQSKPTVVFAMNAVAIVPLAGLLSHATQCVASKMGDTWASLINVTFGNAVELIIL